MSRIPPVDRNTTNDSVRRNFDAVQKQLGVVPNMMRTMAQSPSVLEGYLGFGAALRRGRLPGALHEQIALAVAETNSCDYCLSAHTALGRGAGLSNDELAASREARAADPKAAAALQFARAVLDRRGDVRDQDLATCPRRRLHRWRDCGNHRARGAERLHELLQSSGANRHRLSVGDGRPARISRPCLAHALPDSDSASISSRTPRSSILRRPTASFPLRAASIPNSMPF